MADNKSFSRAILEGVVVAAIVGAGSWALKFVPVFGFGQWLSKEAAVPYWVIGGVALVLPLLFVLALNSIRLSSAESASTEPSRSEPPPTWRPAGLTLSALKALRTVDASSLSPREVRQMLRVLDLGTHPLSDVKLALKELEQASYAYCNYSSLGELYKLADEGIRFAQREGIAPMSSAELRSLNHAMTRLQD